MLRDDYEFSDTRKNKTVSIKPHRTQFYPWEKEWEEEGTINASHTIECTIQRYSNVRARTVNVRIKQEEKYAHLNMVMLLLWILKWAKSNI